MYFKLLICVTLFIPFGSFCQAQTGSWVLRLSEDNDFINIAFSGTDKAYTHGFRADLLYTKRNGAPGFDERLTLKAGNKSIDTFGWSIVQTMITPNNLSNPAIEATDYRYACSINLLRTRHSSNPIRKYNLQTEYNVGIMGPIALGKETQSTIHKLINDEIPRGWNTQLKTSVLLNVNLTGEKQLVAVAKSIDYIGGIKSFIGTSLTALSVYTSLRIGKMNPYFGGYLPQYLSQGGESWQLYGHLCPSLDIVFRNAHLQGGMFRPEYTIVNNNGMATTEPPRKINSVGYNLSYGIVLTAKKLCITFTQRDLYPMIKKQGRHQVGNISIYITL
ncbi:MAG TPA: lipid A-modifier LpxR family protein [Chryseolinea sp.]